MKMLLIILITVAGAQGNAGQTGHEFSQSELIAVMNEHNTNLKQGEYELDLSETCEFEFDGELINDKCIQK